jgi:DNA-binding transcriptional MerR regulator
MGAPPVDRSDDEKAIDEMTVDELAQRAGLPVRTIREYQSLGLLPGPQRRGRVGYYRHSHLARLQLIGRLQRRGYSLAGIGDLLDSWRDGADIGTVLGLAADELVHLDEPGAPVGLHQLARLLPDLVPGRLEDLLANGVVARCGPDRFCVPSPSLLQLLLDCTSAGYPPDRVLALLATIASATARIADVTVEMLTNPPDGADAEQIVRLARRGRGLLAHGTGRMTINLIGRRLADTAPDSDSSNLRAALIEGIDR